MSTIDDLRARARARLYDAFDALIEVELRRMELLVLAHRLVAEQGGMEAVLMTAPETPKWERPERPEFSHLVPTIFPPGGTRR